MSVLWKPVRQDLSVSARRTILAILEFRSDMELGLGSQDLETYERT